ncbi:MAG: hypothetical protein G3M70_14360 [Candidatus Nitronauta litoralis]|uniref:Uncharacterized protein n=1 Tax=Candidatus Nitronauta litoralis TaxID=2705533 RepID=A0A7T0BY09_9BACT|nr:MAG: hypothetical protein G3M70_14360 [Candidatus Nitronauta litoralis]
MKTQSQFRLPTGSGQAWALCIALCFGVMTLFSPILHDHDWDPFHAESDCAPCNWTQSNVSLEVQTPDTSVDFRIIVWQLPALGTIPARFLKTFNSRSPPSFR